MNKKIFLSIIIFIILIIVCASIVNANYTKNNISKETAKELLKDLPAKDYERDYEKAAQIMTKYSNGEDVKIEDYSNVKNNNNNLKKVTSKDDTSIDEVKWKLSAAYRAYKSNTLTYDILISEIKSTISAKDIQLEPLTIKGSEGKTLKNFEEEKKNIINDERKKQESLLKLVEDAKLKTNEDVYKLYEKYDKIRNESKDKMNALKTE